MNSAADIWEKVLEILKRDLTSTAIDTWFNDCTAIDIKNNKLILVSPVSFKRDVIVDRFMPLIQNALYEIFSGEFEVAILTGAEAESYNAPKTRNDDSAYDIYTFDRFVVGNSNRLAHAAALAVAEERTKEYNPLFIYGNSGLGKTHLLNAIRLKIRERHPEYNIVYAKGDEFTNELIGAIQSAKTIEFREKYRGADMFLMDDVQFIAGRNSSQEEFFNTFNTLFEYHKQIVLISDRPPAEITKLDARLRTRFESGLIVDIKPPDYETRIAIVKNKAMQLGILLDNDICDYVSNVITANVRQLEGAVKKIKAYQDLMTEKLTTQTVSTILEDFYKDNKEAPTPQFIIEETANYFALKPEDLKGQSRSRNIVIARQTAMYIIRRLTNLPLTEIGTYFENRDHATVLSSIRKVEAAIKENSEASQAIKDITSNVNSKNT